MIRGTNAARMDNRFYFGFNTSEERKKRRKAELYSTSEQVSTFFWDEAPQHGLEMREGQQDMSFEIVDALINDLHFAIEAGVGIGKSFGYLGQGFSTRSGFLQS